MVYTNISSEGHTERERERTKNRLGLPNFNAKELPAALYNSAISFASIVKNCAYLGEHYDAACEKCFLVDLQTKSWSMASSHRHLRHVSRSNQESETVTCNHSVLSWSFSHLKSRIHSARTLGTGFPTGLNMEKHAEHGKTKYYKTQAIKPNKESHIKLIRIHLR